MAWRECDNCGGTMAQSADVCVRCREDRNAPGSGQPRFSEAARNAPQEMGGLLALYPAAGQVVCFVGWCTGGVIGLNDSGALVWAAELSYVGSVLAGRSREAISPMRSSQYTVKPSESSKSEGVGR